MKDVLSICSALLLAAGTAGSATCHVAPNGSDANPGAVEKPFATLEDARDALRKAGSESRSVALRWAGATAGLVAAGRNGRAPTFILVTRDF